MTATDEPPLRTLSMTRAAQLALLLLVSAGALFAASTLNPLQEAVRLSMALSDNQIALLQGPAKALPVILLSIPIGLLVDRLSRARMLILLSFGNVVGTAYTAIAPDMIHLFIARCLLGLTGLATAVAIFSLIADLYAPEQRGRANMAILIAQFGGIAGAFALGGHLLVTSGASDVDWRAAMMWLALPLALIALASLFLREPPRRGGPAGRVPVASSFRLLWADRPVVIPMLAGIVMIEVMIGAALTWAAPALMRDHAIDGAVAGSIMSFVVFAGGVIGSIVGGWLADHCQGKAGPAGTTAMLARLALVAVPASLFAITADLWLAGFLLFLLMALFSALIVIAIAVLTIIVSERVRGLVLSVMVGLNAIFALALAPLAVSITSGWLGGLAKLGTALTIICAATSLLAVLAFAWARRALADRAKEPLGFGREALG